LKAKRVKNTSCIRASYVRDVYELGNKHTIFFSDRIVITLTYKTFC
jgi:hypothetical protein